MLDELRGETAAGAIRCGHHGCWPAGRPAARPSFDQGPLTLLQTLRQWRREGKASAAPTPYASTGPSSMAGLQSSRATVLGVPDRRAVAKTSRMQARQCCARWVSGWRRTVVWQARGPWRLAIAACGCLAVGLSCKGAAVEWSRRRVCAGRGGAGSWEPPEPHRNSSTSRTSGKLLTRESCAERGTLWAWLGSSAEMAAAGATFEVVIRR